MADVRSVTQILSDNIETIHELQAYASTVGFQNTKIVEEIQKVGIHLDVALNLMRNQGEEHRGDMTYEQFCLHVERGKIRSHVKEINDFLQGIEAESNGLNSLRELMRLSEILSFVSSELQSRYYEEV